MLPRYAALVSRSELRYTTLVLTFNQRKGGRRGVWVRMSRLNDSAKRGQEVQGD